MEGEMLVAAAIYYLIYYACIFMVILVNIIGIFVFIGKRLNPSSLSRNIFVVIAVIDIGLVSLFIGRALLNLIFETVHGIVSLNNGYFLVDNSIIEEMAVRKLIELGFSLSVIYLSVLVLESLASFLGGYIVGKVVRQHEIIYGFLIGLGLVLFSVSFEDGYFLGRNINNLYLILIYTARFLSAALGGYIAFFQKERNQVKFPLENAIKFNKQGKPLKAQKLLKPLIATNHHNLPAWFLFVETCPTYQQKINVLEICLEQNPDNEKVKQMLDKLRKMADASAC
jgi:hypothetical protein